MGHLRDRSLSFRVINVLVSGSLTVLVITEPSVIWAGYLFFFFPGLNLFSAPSWFFYSTALAFVAFLLRHLGRMRWLVAILLLALPAFSIPYKIGRAHV